MSRAAAILCLCLVGLLALAVAPWTMSSGRLDGQIKAQLRDGYGLAFESSGRTTFALLPQPRIKFDAVALRNADGSTLVEHAQLRGELRLLPLLRGRFEISDLSLARATISVAIGADGHTSWDVPAAKMRARAEGSSGASASHLRRLLLTDATLAIDDRRTGARTDLADVNLLVRWPSPESMLDLVGSATWRGERVDTAVSDLQPAALARGGTSRVEARANSRLGDVAISGEIGAAGPLRLNGQVTASAPALDRALRWSGIADPPPATGRAFDLTGEIALAPGEIALPRTRLRLGGEQLDGTVVARLDGARPSLRATLAGGNLDLSSALTGARETWRSDPIDLDGLRSVDVDLRLSAANATIGNLRLGDAAGSLLTTSDRIEVSLGRAVLNGGIVKGRLSLGWNALECDVKAQTSFARLDLGGMLSALGSPRALTGAVQGQANLDANGLTPDDLLRSLSGRFGMSISGGELQGVALGQGVRRAGEASGSSSWRGGRTPFQHLMLALTLADGVAHITEGSLDSPAVHASVQGRASMADGTVALTVRAVPPAEDSADRSAFLLKVTGPWDQVRLVSGADPVTESPVAPP